MRGSLFDVFQLLPSLIFNITMIHEGNQCSIQCESTVLLVSIVYNGVYSHVFSYDVDSLHRNVQLLAESIGGHILGLSAAVSCEKWYCTHFILNIFFCFIQQDNNYSSSLFTGSMVSVCLHVMSLFCFCLRKYTRTISRHG